MVGGSLLVALLLRLPALDMPLNRDEALYATIGSVGGLFDVLPYADVFDHKQPLIYGVYWLLDLVAPRKLGAIRMAAAVPPGLASAALILALAPCIGRARALAAGALALVATASLLVEGTDLNTEHLLALTGALPVLYALTMARSPWRWTPVVCGLLLGLAMLTKAVAVFLLPALVPALLAGAAVRERSGPRELFLFAAGAAAVPLTVALWYAARGALDDLWYANYTFNRLYVDAVPRRLLPTGRTEILTLVTVGTAVGILALLDRRGRSLLVGTLLLWLAGAAVGAQLSSRGFPHYYAPVLLPACALLCVPIVGADRAPAARRAAAAVATVAALIVVGPFARTVADTIGKTGSQLAIEAYGTEARPWLVQYAVGSAIRERASPGDRLHVFGSEPGFYWTSGVRPASKFAYDIPFSIDPSRYLPVVQRELCRRPPRFLVDPAARELAPRPRCLATLSYRPFIAINGATALELVRR